MRAGEGREVELGRSLLAKIHLAYFRPVPATGRLELYVKTEAGEELVQEISDAALASHLNILQCHVLDRARGRR